MQDQPTPASSPASRHLTFAWWWLPLFIVGGQLLMRLTGYTAWAAQAGQEFMLSFMFYMALLGVLLAGRCYLVLHKLLAQEAATTQSPPTSPTEDARTSPQDRN